MVGRMVASENGSPRPRPYSSDNPAFIVGVPRSGTTLLVNLVGFHPLLAPIYETRFLRNLFDLCNSLCWFYGRSIPRQAAGLLREPAVRARMHRECDRFREKAIKYSTYSSSFLRKQEYESFPFGQITCIHYTQEDLIRETDRWLEKVKSGGLSSASVWTSAQEYINRLFAIHCERMGKPHWINKTPGFLNHLDGLSRLYPQAPLIHVVRDGRDVALSNLSLRWGPSTVKQAARRWKALFMEGQNTIKAKNLRCTVVRYEELVDSPKAVLANLFEFLGLDADLDAILSAMPVSKARSGAWRAKFSREDRRIFAKEAGDLLIELGYESTRKWV
jgi:hypothetical protein